MAKLSNTNASLESRAASIKKNKAIKKLVLLSMKLLTVLIVLVFIVSAMYSRFDGFTVAVDREKLKYGLTLSETKTFDEPTTTIDWHATYDITNIAGDTLPSDAELSLIDGENSGINYLCYTFYCKNAGTETVRLHYYMDINRADKGIEKAVRVRMITKLNDEDFVSTDYACATLTSDGKPAHEMIPRECKDFVNDKKVMNDYIPDFKPGNVFKTTVVIWLEGNDPECVDNILGGVLTVSLTYDCEPQAAS